MNIWKCKFNRKSNSPHKDNNVLFDKSLISKARISLMKKNIHLSRKNVLVNSPNNTYRKGKELCRELPRSRNEIFLDNALAKHRKEKEEELKQINQIRKMLVSNKVSSYHNLHLNNPFDTDREFYENIKNQMISINKHSFKYSFQNKKSSSVSLPAITANTEIIRSPIYANYNYTKSQCNILKKKIRSLRNFPLESKEYKFHILIKKIHGLNDDNKRKKVLFTPKHTYK